MKRSIEVIPLKVSASNFWGGLKNCTNLGATVKFCMLIDPQKENILMRDFLYETPNNMNVDGVWMLNSYFVLWRQLMNRST
jgi:hypothetical protein